MAVTPWRLGFSSCPNDTFMFDALVRGAVEVVQPLQVVMEDIEALNRRVLDSQGDVLEVTKLSIATWAHARERYVALPAGAALGRGCGPLIVAREAADLPGLQGRRIAVPGLGTTAYALLRMFGPQHTPVPMRFDAVMPAVASGEVDAGLIIHESRFTYAEHGLVQVADLGVVWEADTGLPLPLGIIAARRELGAAAARAFAASLRASVEFAWAHPQASAPYIRAHAAEMEASVCARHIDLYVNAFSADLGDEGRAAVETFVAKSVAAGVVPASDAPVF